jgi:hypothetical protein
MATSREKLEAEALDLGLRFLAETDGEIADALYLVYSHYRERFIEERGLMDIAPGQNLEWDLALRDARTLRQHVDQTWACAIVEAFS